MRNKQKGFGFYLFIGALFVGMLFINIKFFKSSSGTNIGITDAMAYKISSEKSGFIKRVLVVPGQEIKAGDLLLEMENNVLDMEITKLQSRIAAMKKERVEKAALVKSKVDYLQAEGGIKVEELQAEIQQIHSELELNTKLTDQFSPLQGAAAGNTQELSPEKLKMESLQAKSNLYHQATNIKIKELVKDNAAALLVLVNEIELKERELKLMQSERKQLNKYATHSGVVESVFVKPGEQIQSFAPIISINPIHPSSIVGYLAGKRAHEMPIGAKVAVTSYERRDITSTGEVIGFGAVVELPELLQKSTAVKAFGRQVFIKIPENNRFATGEKVLIK
jgi:multidrug resistance efflux pump